MKATRGLLGRWPIASCGSVLLLYRDGWLRAHSLYGGLQSAPFPRRVKSSGDQESIGWTHCIREPRRWCPRGRLSHPVESKTVVGKAESKVGGRRRPIRAKCAAVVLRGNPREQSV